MKNKTKEVKVEQLKVVEAEAQCPIRGSKDVSIPVPNSIHHSGSKEKVSWSISLKDAEAIRKVIEDINDELLDVYAEERIAWKKNGKKGRRPVMKTEFLPADVYRMIAHLGRIAIEEMMSKGIALPTKR